MPEMSSRMRGRIRITQLKTEEYRRQTTNESQIIPVIRVFGDHLVILTEYVLRDKGLLMVVLLVRVHFVSRCRSC
jgi:hypothetical protein